jgi:DNA invertase Pin-like site-specific DNA recombinase
MTSQRIGYIRVSSLDQNAERQLDGLPLDKVFTDKASGKDTNRPQLQAALNHVRAGDTLVVHSMDRLARNVEDMLRLVREMNDRGVSWNSLKRT